MTKEEILAKYCHTYALANIEEYSNALSVMDEYAKQQAIEFVKWAIEGGKIMGDNWGDAFIPGSEDELYDQFIESQSKQP